jgi:FtsZ-binding cell division protein ZapB
MDTMEALESKINQAVAFIDKLSAENKVLGKENNELKEMISSFEKKMAALEKKDSIRAEKVRDKLGRILSKLNDLEKY